MKPIKFPLQKSLAGCFADLSGIAKRILFFGLPYLTLHTAVVAVLLFRTLKESPTLAYPLFFPQLESLICSLTILIGGAALFDILEKRESK